LIGDFGNGYGYGLIFFERQLLLPYFFLTIKRACDKLSALWTVFALIICLFSKTLRREFLFLRPLNKVIENEPAFFNYAVIGEYVLMDATVL
jgi:hypothetical protein